MDSREPQLIVAERPAGLVAADTDQLWSPRADAERVRPIGQLLIEAGLIGEADLARALAFQERYGGRLGSILVRLGALSEERLLPILSNQLGIPVLADDALPN